MGSFFKLRSNRLFGGAVMKRYIEDNCQEIKRKMQVTEEHTVLMNSLVN